MKPVKDSARVEAMWQSGQPFYTDKESGYRYTMVAKCPKDGGNSSPAQVYKQGQAIDRVVFQCSVCGDRFEAARGDIEVY
jgi:hypothetical protein